MSYLQYWTGGNGNVIFFQKTGGRRVRGVKEVKKMTGRRRRATSVLALAALVLLAGLSAACTDEVELEVRIWSFDRYVTGYVKDAETGLPVEGAEVLVECSDESGLYLGYTDAWGYFEVNVGEWDDLDGAVFRVYSIRAAGYYDYAAEETWYGITAGEDEIYTGVYLLDRLP